MDMVFRKRESGSQIKAVPIANPRIERTFKSMSAPRASNREMIAISPP
jgi:hypothetical protein